MLFILVVILFFTDIDECVNHAVDCGKNQICFNQRGDYQCVDTTCPDRYIRDPQTGLALYQSVIIRSSFIMTPHPGHTDTGLIKSFLCDESYIFKRGSSTTYVNNYMFHQFRIVVFV